MRRVGSSSNPDWSFDIWQRQAHIGHRDRGRRNRSGRAGVGPADDAPKALGEQDCILIVLERFLRKSLAYRRRRVYEKRADIHEAFLSLGCALICWQSLRKTWTAG